MNERDELAELIRGVDGPATLGGEELAEAILAAGYRKHPKVERDDLRGTLSNTICNASNYPPKAMPYLLGGDMSEVLDRTTDAILAAGYRKPRTITTAEELDEAIRGAFEEGEHLVLMTGERPWDIWEDEDGGLHVSSSPYEDDPERLTLANITLPATVLWELR